MNTSMDVLGTALLDLSAELQELPVPMLIGGGFGLYLKQLHLQEGKCQKVGGGAFRRRTVTFRAPCPRYLQSRSPRLEYPFTHANPQSPPAFWHSPNPFLGSGPSPLLPCWQRCRKLVRSIPRPLPAWPAWRRSPGSPATGKDAASCKVAAEGYARPFTCQLSRRSHVTPTLLGSTVNSAWPASRPRWQSPLSCASSCCWPTR